MEIQPIAPLIQQMFLTKAGMFCSERLSVDIVYLNQCIDLLLPTFDKKKVKLEYDKIHGEGKWDLIMKKKKKLSNRLSETKLFYDSLENKSLVKKIGLKTGRIEEIIQNIFRKFFYKNSSRISLMQPDIYDLFVFLVSYSDIQRRQISMEFFRNLEQKDNRHIKLGKDRMRTN